MIGLASYHLTERHYEPYVSTSANSRQTDRRADPADGPNIASPDERVARAVETIAAEQASEDSARREARDLKAQEDMADWAFWMVLVSTFQSFIAIGGTFALIVTIRQGRKALGIGRKSVDAAKQSTAVTVAKDRAFVFMDGIEIQQITNKERTKVLSYSFAVRLKNSGATPTKSMRFWVSCQTLIKDTPEKIDFIDYGRHEKSEFGRATLGPQDTILAGAMPLTYQEAMSLYRERSGFYIWGWVEYGDVFKDTPRHRTEFCHEMIINNDPAVLGGSLGERHAPVTKYNNIDDECLKPIQTNPPHDGT